METKQQIKERIISKIQKRYKIDSYRKVVENICDIAIEESSKQQDLEKTK